MFTNRRGRRSGIGGFGVGSEKMWKVRRIRRGEVSGRSEYGSEKKVTGFGEYEVGSEWTKERFRK